MGWTIIGEFVSTLADRIELELRADLIGGVHRPSSPLRMEKLVQRYGTGTSPVREALSRLYAEGLIELKSNSGFRVPALTRDDLADIAFARVTIETAALRRVMEGEDDSWEAALVGALHHYRSCSRKLDTNDPRRLGEWQKAHDGLHQALIAGAASPRIEQMQRRLLAQHSRYRQLLYRVPIDLDVHEREHVDLVEAVLARDLATATEMMAQHIRITLDVLDQWGVWDDRDDREAGDVLLLPA